MPRQRNPNCEKAFEIYKQHNGNISNREIATILGENEKVIAVWKGRGKWNVVQQSNESCTTNKKPKPKRKRKRGGQPGNNNATGPPGNKHAEKYGFFSKHLPEETFSIIQEMPEDPLDILWDQIQISYAAIIRAQKIMYVRDQDDVTTTKIAESCGDTMSEKWEVQQAWDKQANFLQAQSRAQKTLEGMISRYEDLLHKNWELATEEQKARLANIKAQTEKIKGVEQDSTEDKVKKLFDAIGGALDAES